jgi:hypothetical protein
MRNDSGISPRNIHGDDAMSQTLTYPDLITGFLRGRFGLERGAEKRLARAGKCSPRTVENWMRGQSAPAGEHLLNLMAECDGLAEAVLAEVQRRRRAPSVGSA